MYGHYCYLINESKKLSFDTSIFKSFISNSLIIKITELNDEDYKIYLKKLKKDKVFDNLLTDTFQRKIKKFLLSDRETLEISLQVMVLRQDVTLNVAFILWQRNFL